MEKDKASLRERAERLGRTTGRHVPRRPAARSRAARSGVALIGVDLAWSPRHASGVAALRPDGPALVVAEVGLAGGVEEVADFVARHRAATTVVMVDAPLVVPNDAGMRPVERELHRRFGAAHAGPYPANRALLGRCNRDVPRGEELGLALARRAGVAWPPGRLPRPGARGAWLFECYPHPAQVVLFGLERVLKYKLKRQGLEAARAEYRRYLECLDGLRAPRLRWTAAARREVDATVRAGRAYKSAEDRLDAVFCAYLGALALDGRLEMVGRPEEGSIVVPRQGASRWRTQPASSRR